MTEIVFMRTQQDTSYSWYHRLIAQPWVIFSSNFDCNDLIVMSREVRDHYSDAIMGAMASEIPMVSIVYSTICSGADQWKHRSSASLAFVREIHRWPVNSLQKGPVTRKMFPFDDVIIYTCIFLRKPIFTLKYIHHIILISSRQW